MNTSAVHGRIELVNIGAVAALALPNGKSAQSAVKKRPQTSSVEVTPQGLAGDEIADRVHHGGPRRALHVFCMEHYEHFEARVEGEAPPRPWVGENLTVSGYTDSIARVGDVLRVGTALTKVTMPTERCGHPGIAVGLHELRSWMVKSLRTGFYLEVLEPGRVAAGDAIEVVERGPERLTIEALSRVLYEEVGDEARVVDLEAVDELAWEFKARLRILHERRKHARGATTVTL